MFCPVCKAEYRAGFYRCSDCDVDLIADLPTPGQSGAAADSPEAAADLDSPELLWSGVDGGAFARITAALGEADVPFNDETPGARLLYASMRHPLEVWIQRADRDAAKRVLAQVLGTSADGEPAASDEIPADLTRAVPAPGQSPTPLGDPAREPVRSQGPTGVILRPEGPRDLSRNPSDQPWEEPAEPVADDLLDDFDPDEATLEVWSGDAKGMAQMLKDCLRENGIGCVIDGVAAGNQRVLVRPENETRTREIVREVVEGVPPE
jgi:hypothetical protein